MRCHAFKLIELLHRTIEESLESNAQSFDSWDENHLTIEWLKDIRRALTNSNERSGSINLEMAAFRLSGHQETLFGDVAILARILPAGATTPFLGTAFLEAKRSNYKEPLNYNGFREDQRKRVSAGNPHHRYVFYRRKSYSQELWSEQAFMQAAYPFLVQMRRSSVQPTYLIPCYRTPLGDSVFDAGIPLSRQIFRYCYGWDLDIQPDDAHPVVLPEGVSFVLVIAVGHDNAEAPELPEAPEGYVPLNGGDDYRPISGGASS